MKSSSKYESMAAVLALVGAIGLLAVYYPVLNPVQFGLDSGRDSAPFSRYIFGTPASLFILVAAWHFNRKTARLKREESDAERSKKTPT